MKTYTVWVRNKAVGTVQAETWAAALDVAIKLYGNCWVTE